VIAKQASGPAKIDPLMAAFNATTRMVMNPASSLSEPSLLFV
jgi:phage terminase large subunit-like protein